MSFWRHSFAIDLRALAAFRVLLGVTLTGYFSGIDTEANSNGLIWIGVISSVMVCLGYRTRAAVMALWLVLLTTIWMTDTLPNTMTRIMLALLFLSIFLPLGARYSLDISVDPKPHPDNSFLSLASIALTLQVGWFFVGAIINQWLLVQPSPAPAGYDAPAVAVGLIGLVALMPAAVFDSLSRRARKTHRGDLRIYYDRDCGFCRKICLIFRTFLVLGDTPVKPAQDNPEAFAIMEEHNTWVVYDFDGSSFIRWHAVLLLLRRSLLFGPLGVVLTAIRMGEWCDWLYGAIASTRGWWSKVSAVLLPYRPVRASRGVWTDLLLAGWFGLVLAFNLWPDFAAHVSTIPAANSLTAGLAADQFWILTEMHGATP